jgi:hypothetical protein
MEGVFPASARGWDVVGKEDLVCNPIIFLEISGEESPFLGLRDSNKYPLKSSPIKVMATFL